MIACVTPAEFHLSETLNTIQVIASGPSDEDWLDKESRLTDFVFSMPNAHVRFRVSPGFSKFRMMVI